MRDFLLVDSRYSAIFGQLGLDTAAAAMRLFGQPAAVNSPEVIVAPQQLRCPDGRVVDLFCKQYCYPAPSWRFWGRASKARREFESYAVFERLGIRCAQRVACGESRDHLGRLKHAFIWTQTVPCAVPLDQFIGELPQADAQACALRMTLGDDLARMVSRLHQAQFFHNDIYWRNVLVATGDNRPPTLFWIDCPRGSFAWSKSSANRRRLKDLAALDRDAVNLCSLKERLRFLGIYLGTARLGIEGKRLARAIVRYREQRWHSDVSR